MKKMKSARVILSTLLVLGVSAGLAKKSKCPRHYKNLKKKDEKVIQRLEAGKPGSAKLNLQAFNKTIDKLKKENCPDVSKYEARAAELEVLISQGDKKSECDDIAKGMKIKMDYVTKAMDAGINGASASIYLDNLEMYNKLLAKSAEKNCVKNPEELKAKSDKLTKQLQAMQIKSNPFKFFVQAVKANDYKEIENVIANGLNLNATYSRSLSPLMWAVSKADQKLIEFLISKGADVNFANDGKKVALDFESETLAISAKDLDIKLYLISKGADPSKANMYRIGYNFIDNKNFDMFKKIEAAPGVKFSTQSYSSYFWNTPRGHAMKKYLAPKIKAGKMGKKYADYKAGMKNAGLAKNMLAVGKGFQGDKYTKVKIASQDWVINRNQLTGIITSRDIYAYLYAVSPEGIPFVDKIRFNQSYNGSKYGKLLFGHISSRDTVDP